MNVSSPQKSRIPHTKDNQPKGTPILPTQPIIVNNAIPKQHVGAGKNNQLNFEPEVGRIFSPAGNQTSFNSIPTNDFYTDQNPFDLLPENLFDVSLSEDDILNQPETNKEPVVNKPIEEVPKVVPEEVYQPQINNQHPQETTEDEYEESSPQDEPRSSIHPNNKPKPLANHPLTPLVEKWLEQNSPNRKTFTDYKSKMKKFIKFLIDKEVKAPTQKDICLYSQMLDKEHNRHFSTNYLSAVRAFFKWTADAGLYEDITLGTKGRLHKVYQQEDVQSSKQLTSPQPIIRTVPRATITISDMEKAQFLHKQAEYLINSDLRVFKQWIETMDIIDINDQRKFYILKFAHFLHSENRTTPTQQDIIDYYNKYLRTFWHNTVNNSLLPIRRFFEWTSKNGIYPNIAFNICRTHRRPLNDYDIPILLDQKVLQDIPKPTKPLISKTI